MKKAIEIILILVLIVLSWVFFIKEVSQFPIIVLVISCIILILAIPIKEKKEEIEEEQIKEEKLIDNDAPAINFPKNFNEQKFLTTVFDLYKSIQENFMNFKYDELMSNLGLDIYNQFSVQMKKLQTRNKQSVRTNIELDKIETISFAQYDGYNEAVVNLVVLEDKYMKNQKEEKKKTSSGVRYESGYSITLINRDTKKSVKKCSNCTEKIANQTKCPKCKTMLVEATNTWIMTDLKLLGSHSKK